MVKLRDELVVIDILSLLLIIVVTWLPLDWLRILLGLPFILFFPGYTLVAALFPGKGDVGGIQRIALSFGLSIAVVVVVGLILNYTPWGIGLYPILVAVTVFILAASATALYRRGRLLEGQRLRLRFKVDASRWAAVSHCDKALYLILVMSLLGAIGTMAYVFATPRVEQEFTEFYVLGPGGNATSYPSELTLGDEGSVVLGIVSHEHEDSTVYRVEIVIDGEHSSTIGPLALRHDEKWEEEVSFLPQKAGASQKVEFILYRNPEETPYKSLYLRLDVNA